MRTKGTTGKTCYCHTCNKYFHYLGITRHRAAHRDRGEDCTITFTHGDTYTYRHAPKEKQQEDSQATQ